MAIGTTVESELTFLDEFWDGHTAVLKLCDTTTWSSPPTAAELTASVIAEVDGYTFQTITPTTPAAANGQTAERVFQNASIGLTANTLNYTGYCIFRDGTEPVIPRSYTSTRTIDSAGAAHEFNSIVHFRTATFA